MDGIGPDLNRYWAALPAHERARRWQTHFRITTDVLDALLAIVEPHMKQVGPNYDAAYMRTVAGTNCL